MIEKTFFKVQPWAHQLQAINEAKEKEGYGFFFEVGAGKTMTCINTLRIKYQKHGRLLKTLIIAPPIVLENWKKEILMHSNINAKDVVILYGTGKKRLEILEKYKDRNVILITNYETLTMGSRKDSRKRRIPGPLFAALKAWAPECLVLDESHRCKDLRTARTEAAVELADQTYYKFILSGTPILNSMLDIFSQFRILDSGKTFGKNFFAFRGQYFVDKNAGMQKDRYFPNWVPRQGAADEVNRLVRRKSMHVTKAECLDLPPLVRQTIPVPMSKEQEKIYEQMKNDFIAYIDDKAAVAELAITKALRLQQIVSGFVNVEEGGGERTATRFKNNPRKDALKQLLEDIAPYNKVLVWAVFKENYNDIREVCEKLKLDYVEVHGEVTQKNKMDAVERLNNDPKCRVLIGHPGSGGIGINLVSASHSIFYSRSFSLEYDIQAEARNYRGGSEQHEKVTRIDLVTPNTIDEQVQKALASKKQIGYQVLRDFVKSKGV